MGVFVASKCVCFVCSNRRLLQLATVVFTDWPAPSAEAALTCSSILVPPAASCPFSVLINSILLVLFSLAAKLRRKTGFMPKLFQLIHESLAVRSFVLCVVCYMKFRSNVSIICPSFCSLSMFAI